MKKINIFLLIAGLSLVLTACFSDYSGNYPHTTTYAPPMNNDVYINDDGDYPETFDYYDDESYYYYDESVTEIQAGNSNVNIEKSIVGTWSTNVTMDDYTNALWNYKRVGEKSGYFAPTFIGNPIIFFDDGTVERRLESLVFTNKYFFEDGCLVIRQSGLFGIEVDTRYFITMGSKNEMTLLEPDEYSVFYSPTSYVKN